MDPSCGDHRWDSHSHSPQRALLPRPVLVCMSVSVCVCVCMRTIMCVCAVYRITL